MKHTSGRGSLFLTELLISLLLFALCAAVCVGLLAYSHLMSRRSGQLSDAVFLAQTMAEEFKAGLPLSAGADGYAVSTALHSSGGVDYLTISVSYDGDDLYTLTAARVEEGSLIS